MSAIHEENGEDLNDGSHIIYVNGNYKGNDDIGKLMEDFRATTSEGMNFKELANGLHHFKETEEGCTMSSGHRVCTDRSGTETVILYANQYKNMLRNMPQIKKLRM